MALHRRPLLGAAIAFALPAQAQPAWRPERPIQLWVGFAPGGTVDAMSRAVAQHIERSRGWVMPVTVRTGGAGVVMASALRTAPADGQTLGATVSFALQLPALTLAPPPYALEDFALVSRLGRIELMLCARTDGPLGSVPALVEAARQRGQLNVAVQGPEVTLGLLALARHLGVTLEPIPVRGGAEGLTQLLGGHVDAAILAGVQAPAVREGRLRELVALAGEPSRLTPTAPTLRALGLDLAIEPWLQIIAPRGVPRPAIEGIAAAIAEALADPEIRALATERLGIVPAFVGPAETEARAVEEAAMLRRLHAAFGR
ncbi:MAG: tripartite tricarboxylate transporter substrate binding protein [Rubritepida sp.]|nr:tripartite tricarboxylate transporter substrate binding protein [Rubritepida sp.]